jgi:fructose-1-phosphate kinase PfkB-like protein
LEQKDLNTAALELVNSFLRPGVDTEVNVSDHMKKNITHLVLNGETLEHQQEFMRYLDKAQNEILMIMAMGAFPRFMKSTLFTDYKRKAREMEDAEDLRGPERAQ